MVAGFADVLAHRSPSTVININIGIGSCLVVPFINDSSTEMN